VPCFHPIATAIYVDRWNEVMGGEPGVGKRLLCFCCCAQCSICQLARAVKKAEESGTLRKVGSPSIIEMSR
jgi:hypothetical protein